MNVLNRYELELEGKTVVIRCFGEWGLPLALEFLDALERQVGEVPSGTAWATLVDFTGWEAVAPEVWEITHKVVELCNERGRTHSAYSFGSLEIGQKMVEKGIVDPESKHIRHFATESLAREWLGALGYLND
ncbi:MAG: hypothetical protein AAGE01_12710 [Pseudomonadota bacterium]